MDCFEDGSCRSERLDLLVPPNSALQTDGAGRLAPLARPPRGGTRVVGLVKRSGHASSRAH